MKVEEVEIGMRVRKECLTPNTYRTGTVKRWKRQGDAAQVWVKWDNFPAELECYVSDLHPLLATDKQTKRGEV